MLIYSHAALYLPQFSSYCHSVSKWKHDLRNKTSRTNRHHMLQPKCFRFDRNYFPDNNDMTERFGCVYESILLCLTALSYVRPHGLHESFSVVAADFFSVKGFTSFWGLFSRMRMSASVSVWGFHYSMLMNIVSCVNILDNVPKGFSQWCVCDDPQGHGFSRKAPLRETGLDWRCLKRFHSLSKRPLQGSLTYDGKQTCCVVTDTRQGSYSVLVWESHKGSAKLKRN